MSTAWAAQGLRQGCSSACRPLIAPLHTPLTPRPSSSAAQHQQRSVVARASERVLRYPDGRERRIIYPDSRPQEPAADEDDDNGALDVGWDICFGLKQQSGGMKRQRPTTYKRVNGPGPCSSPQAQPLPALPQHGDSDSSDTTTSCSKGSISGIGAARVDNSTPGTSRSAAPTSGPELAAYLDSLFAATMEGSQPEVDVEGCYEVLRGCPWLLPRPVFVLARGSRDSELGGAVTLRVRVEQDAADELARVLQNDALSKKLSVSAMKDAVVTFQRVEDADLYATLLAEEGTSDVRMAEVDSHALFRMTSDVQALVVLLRPSDRMPHHYQLAAQLKKQKAWDDL